MKNIKAIGFDLFNTLITVESETLTNAMSRMLESLKKYGMAFDEETFINSYREAAFNCIKQARMDGKETHNSIWISSALKNNGSFIPPNDDIISAAVDHYFSAFYDTCCVLPGTIEMLERMKPRYALGLLSNFTHGPAAREILDRTGLAPHFDVILISGELGYRKPHSKVFEKLIDELGIKGSETLFIGDDPEPDIHGAIRSGLNPVWITYTRDNNIPVVKGILQSENEEPNIEVPRISSWQDLYDLL